MHKIAIPEHARRLVEERGYSGRFLDALDAKRSALLVVDMQNGFVEDGSPFQIPYAKELVPAINRIAGASRRAGARVVWVSTDFRDQAVRWSVWFSHRLRPNVAAEMIACFTPGSHGYELYPELLPQSGDLRIAKTRFSPFIQGSSNLHEMLQAQGIDTLIVAGTVTNTCCETTARDAMMLNYKVVFLSDCNASRTDEEHNATLGNMYQVFADIATVDEVVDVLSGS
jgi:ureidoacrylate peracid hydrolase